MISRGAAIHSHHKRIAAGALVVGLLTLVAKLFVAAREIAIAWRYGVSGTVDAYQLAVTATTWLPLMLAGVIMVVLVPRLVTLRRQDIDSRQFVPELNGSVLILASAFAVLTWLAAPYAAQLLASHTNPVTLHLTAKLTAAMAPVALFIIASAYLSARLQARERFGYSVTEAVPALAIALLVIVSASAGAWPLIAGTLIGYLAQVLVLAGLVRLGDPPLGRISFRHRSPEWDTFRGSFALMLVGQLILTAYIPIDQGFAARLGEGAVATLGYANRIVGLFSGIATVVVARALLSVLSETAADGDFALGRRHAIQWSLFLGIAAALGSAILWLVTPDMVRLLFQRGAFTPAAAAEVASVLRVGLLQLPFYFAAIVFMQWYAAAARFRAVLAINIGAIIVKCALNALLAPRFGVEGIMLSTAGMMAFLLVSYITLLGRGRTADAAKSKP